jgi:hypothetical protein
MGSRGAVKGTNGGQLLHTRNFYASVRNTKGVE